MLRNSLMADVKIRNMREADIEVLSRIYAKVYEDFDVGEKWTVESSRELLSYWYKRQPDLCLVAEIEGKMIGAFVAGIKPWHDGNHLVDGEIFIATEYQKQGIGTVLSIAMYEKALKNYNAVCFDAITFKDKEFPLSWYLSQGFEEIKNWTIISGNLKKVLNRLRKKQDK